MSRASRRPTRFRRALIGGTLLAALAGCQPARPHAPLEDEPGAPPAEHIARPRPTARPVDEPTPSTLREEALAESVPVDPLADPAGAPAPGGAEGAAPTPITGAPATGAASDLPSPLDTIGAGTAPNVAAATRLADLARRELLAGNDSSALERLERAIALDPNNPYAYYFLAVLHLRTRSYDQAIAFAGRAATLARDGAPRWASRALTVQGTAYESAGRFADAREAYQRAVQAAPDNLPAAAGLARTGGSTATTAP